MLCLVLVMLLTLTLTLPPLSADNSSVVSGLGQSVDRLCISNFEPDYSLWIPALIVWDALICLSDEKRQIWDHKLTGSSLLYLVIRYGGLFEFALETVDVAPSVGTTVCINPCRQSETHTHPSPLQGCGHGYYHCFLVETNFMPDVLLPSGSLHSRIYWEQLALVVSALHSVPIHSIDHFW